jgi:hypothetical protein
MQNGFKSHMVKFQSELSDGHLLPMVSEDIMMATFSISSVLTNTGSRIPGLPFFHTVRDFK